MNLKGAQNSDDVTVCGDGWLIQFDYILFFYRRNKRWDRSPLSSLYCIEAIIIIWIVFGFNFFAIQHCLDSLTLLGFQVHFHIEFSFFCSSWMLSSICPLSYVLLKWNVRVRWRNNARYWVITFCSGAESFTNPKIFEVHRCFRWNEHTTEVLIELPVSVGECFLNSFENMQLFYIFFSKKLCIHRCAILIVLYEIFTTEAILSIPA